MRLCYMTISGYHGVISDVPFGWHTELGGGMTSLPLRSSLCPPTAPWNFSLKDTYTAVLWRATTVDGQSFASPPSPPVAPQRHHSCHSASTSNTSNATMALPCSLPCAYFLSICLNISIMSMCCPKIKLKFVKGNPWPPVQCIPVTGEQGKIRNFAKEYHF